MSWFLATVCAVIVIAVVVLGALYWAANDKVGPTW